MRRITNWLKENETYEHKTHGVKDNATFCRQVVAMIQRNKKRAEIRRQGNYIAVYCKQ